MTIPDDKVGKVGEFFSNKTAEILKFIDEEVPEITISDLEQIFTGITHSMREQLSKKLKSRS